MKLFKGFVAVLSIASVQLVQSQTNLCGTDFINQQYGFEHPERMEYRQQMQELIRNGSVEQGAQRSTIVVPTVVHVMHKGGPENISAAQVEDAIRVLNEDLRRQNSDTSNTRPLFKEYGADFNVEFRLAKIDPNGNCTNGITNTFSPITFNADDDIKETNSGGIDPWPVNKYFNIWVVGKIVLDQSGVIGYAYFPSWGMSNNYGVVIDFKFFGTIGSAEGKDGRTLTHEVGHCLELYHTFQSGCGVNCANSGDDVCDTPPTSSATYTCSYALNSCSNDANGPSPYSSNVPDMVENYMSYNQDFCQNIFTKGQKLRSDAVFQNTFVSQLITPQNLLSTGTSDGFVAAPCVLDPDFKWSKATICVGDSIEFTNLTQNGIPDNYQWNITSAQTFTSSDANPVIVFTQAGLYNVSLNVTNASGSQTALKQNIIRVTDSTGTLNWIFVDGFENQPIQTGRWQPKNATFSNGWQEQTISANGNFTLFVNNRVNDADDIIHEVYSPNYDLSYLIDPKFRFKTAFATKNGSSSDRLKLYFSYDCGKTWILRFSKTGSMLESMSPTVLPIQPLSPSDWFNWESDVPSIMEGTNNFMVKFTFETGGGNDFYLDDINIIGIAAIEDEIQTSTLNIYPNPIADNFTIDLTTLHEQSITLSIYDMSGRNIANANVNGGSEVSFSSKSLGLAAGMYRISVKGNSGIMSGKIIVTE